MSPFYIWETFAGCVADGFSKLPAAIRIGWPAPLVQTGLVMGGGRYLMENPGVLSHAQLAAVGLVSFYLVAILYAPVYNALMHRAATGEPADPRWLTYRIDGKAISSGVVFASGFLFIPLFSALVLTPGMLAVSADMWAWMQEILDELRGTISIIGLFDGTIEEALLLVDEAINLNPLAIGAGALFLVGNLLIIWMNTKLSYILPLAAFQGQFFPYFNSFKLSRIQFWKLMFTKLMLLTFLFGLSIVVFWPLMLLGAGVAGTLSVAAGSPVVGLTSVWLMLNLYAFWLLASLSSFHGRLYGLHIVVEELFEQK